MDYFNSKGRLLIRELLSDSKAFYEKGKAYELLQQYFSGFPLDTLSPLLSSEDRMVRRAAVWIISELGTVGVSFVPQITSLVDDDDRYIRYHALEILVVCSHGREILHVLQAMESADEVIRLLAMRLLSRVNGSQLQSVAQIIGDTSDSDRRHKLGVLELLKDDSLSKESLSKMLKDDDPLVRKYGAIALKRSFQDNPS